jgi:dsRNA-specific ribonuclease
MIEQGRRSARVIGKALNAIIGAVFLASGVDIGLVLRIKMSFKQNKQYLGCHEAMLSVD